MKTLKETVLESFITESVMKTVKNVDDAADEVSKKYKAFKSRFQT